MNVFDIVHEVHTLYRWCKAMFELWTEWGESMSKPQKEHIWAKKTIPEWNTAMDLDTTRVTAINEFQILHRPTSENKMRFEFESRWTMLSIFSIIIQQVKSFGTHTVIVDYKNENETKRKESMGLSMLKRAENWFYVLSIDRYAMPNVLCIESLAPRKSSHI